MNAEKVPPQSHRAPSLVHYCQRVASHHIDSISYLGDELSYHLVKPILEKCNVEQLMRLEALTPRLQNETSDIWKDLCLRKYPVASEKYQSGELNEPESWRKQYFLLQEAEAKRLEEISSRLRSQRNQADELKKEREIKYTDRVPPAKRNRWSTAPAQPKTLIQKTRSEASKIQKNIFASRMACPPVKSRHSHAPLLKPSMMNILPTPPGNCDRVTVNTVVRRREPTLTSPVSKTAAKMSSSSVAGCLTSDANQKEPLSPCESEETLKATLPTDSSFFQVPRSPSDTRPHKVSKPLRKDPMASLFVPKHRAYSQLTGAK